VAHAPARTVSRTATIRTGSAARVPAPSASGHELARQAEHTDLGSTARPRVAPGKPPLGPGNPLGLGSRPLVPTQRPLLAWTHWVTASLLLSTVTTAVMAGALGANRRGAACLEDHIASCSPAQLPGDHQALCLCSNTHPRPPHQVRLNAERRGFPAQLCWRAPATSRSSRQ